MKEIKQKRRHAFDAFFISLRTHFNFFRRFATYLFQLSSIFISAFKSVPVLSSFLNLISHALDSLSFGTNANNPPFSHRVAFIGYGTLILLGCINLFIFPLVPPLFIPAVSILLGLYFEGITIKAWFSNYHKLNKELRSGLDIDMRLIENAQLMYHAAVITFASIALKALALSISISFPAAAIGLFIVGQAAEVTAILGSIGKEKVNFSRNHHFWFEQEASDTEIEMIQSYQVLGEKLKIDFTKVKTLFNQDSLLLKNKTPSVSTIENQYTNEPDTSKLPLDDTHKVPAELETHLHYQ